MLRPDSALAEDGKKIGRILVAHVSTNLVYAVAKADSALSKIDSKDRHPILSYDLHTYVCCICKATAPRTTHKHMQIGKHTHTHELYSI